MNKSVYLITLQGQGDTNVKIVDQATFDWILGPPRRPKRADSWVGTFVPPHQLDLMKQGYEDPNFEPRITIGSWENDRAILAQSLPEYGGPFDSLSEALRVIKKLDLNVVDTYEGMIY